MRNLFTGMGGSTTVSSWRTCILAAFAFLVISATFHYTAAATGLSIGERALAAFLFSGLTLVVAVMLGFIIWGGARLAQGEDSSLEMKDTVMWVASLFGVACVALAVLR